MCTHTHTPHSPSLSPITLPSHTHTENDFTFFPVIFTLLCHLINVFKGIWSKHLPWWFGLLYLLTHFCWFKVTLLSQFMSESSERYLLDSIQVNVFWLDIYCFLCFFCVGLENHTAELCWQYTLVTSIASNYLEDIPSILI